MGAFFLFALYRITQRASDTRHEQSVTYTPMTQPLTESLLQAYDERQLPLEFKE